MGLHGAGSYAVLAPSSPRTLGRPRLSAGGIWRRLSFGTERVYGSDSCPDCNRLGYRRRKDLFELIVVDSHFREKLTGKPTLAEIESGARNAGMETLRERCLKEVTAGVTSLEKFLQWRM